MKVGELRAYELMVDDVTDIQVKEQNIIFIQYFDKSVGKGNVRFLNVRDLLEDATSANAEVITTKILRELQHCDIDDKSITKYCSLVSDGASVMVGKTSGVSAG